MRAYAAHLNNAVFCGSKLSLAQLSGADLRGADFTDAKFDRTDLTQSNLSGIKLGEIDKDDVYIAAARNVPASLGGGVTK